jgi:hypothetical protein
MFEKMSIVDSRVAKTERQDGDIEELRAFARRKLLATRESTIDNKSQLSYRQDIAVMLCRVGLVFTPVASMTSVLVADHMATLIARDKDRESMLVSYTSEPMLAFGAMKQWEER